MLFKNVFSSSFLSFFLLFSPSLSFFLSSYSPNPLSFFLSFFLPLYLSYQILRGWWFNKSTLQASSRLHNQLFARVVKAPMIFFDTTPSGRILNRFSKDLDEVSILI